MLGDGCQWPDTARRLDAVRIMATTGYYDLDGTTAIVPDDILHAIKMTVAELDAGRGDEGGGGGSGTTVYAMKQVRAGYLSETVRALLHPYTYQSIAVA